MTPGNQLVKLGRKHAGGKIAPAEPGPQHPLGLVDPLPKLSKTTSIDQTDYPGYLTTSSPVDDIGSNLMHHSRVETWRLNSREVRSSATLASWRIETWGACNHNPMGTKQYNMPEERMPLIFVPDFSRDVF